MTEDYTADGTPFILRSEVDEEAFDLVLKKYYENDQTDVHEFVEDCSGQFHFEYTGCDNPNANY